MREKLLRLGTFFFSLFRLVSISFDLISRSWVLRRWFIVLVFLQHFFCASSHLPRQRKRSWNKQTKSSSLSESSSCFNATLLDLNEVLRRACFSTYPTPPSLTQFSISFAELRTSFDFYGRARQEEEKVLAFKWSLSFPSISFGREKDEKPTKKKKFVKLVTEKNRKWPTC
jgi:hypothetical protein